MKAVILAAGVGSRLQPLTLTTPKPLIEVAGQPIIDRIFSSLPEAIDEVIVVVDHLKEKIKSHVGEEFMGRKVFYAEQGEKKGTFAALQCAKNYLGDDRFLVLNGDDLNSKDELEKFLINERAFGIQKMVMPNYYAISLKDGYIEGFSKQTEEEKTTGAMIATGVYLLDMHIFDHAGVEVSGHEYGLPQTILEQKNRYPIQAIQTKNWLPINSFADLERANIASKL